MDYCDDVSSIIRIYDDCTFNFTFFFCVSLHNGLCEHEHTNRAKKWRCSPPLVVAMRLIWIELWILPINFTSLRCNEIRESRIGETFLSLNLVKLFCTHLLRRITVWHRHRAYSNYAIIDTFKLSVRMISFLIVRSIVASCSLVIATPPVSLSFNWQISYFK